MAGPSNIEWTDATWNPTTGCTRVSSGCDHCYAVSMTHRIENMLNSPAQPKYAGLTVLNDRGDRHFNGKVRCHDDALETPLYWKKPRRIFVNSMSDLFHRDVPFEFIAKVFSTMSMARQHTFQILTKRPERLVEFFDWNYPPAAMTREMAAEDWLGCWPNVWLGTSVEDQKTADERIPHLLKVPAAVRFLSVEPMLGPVDLEHIHANNEYATIDYGQGPGEPKRVVRDALNGYGWYGIAIPDAPGNHQEISDRLETHWGPNGPIGWVIVGGESGRGARPMHPDWVRAVRDQCAAADVPFFFKQWGNYGPAFINMSTGHRTFRQFHDHQQWVNKASTWVNGGICIDRCGRELKNGADFARARDEGTFPVAIVHQQNKKAAGAELEGREHREFPKAEVAA